MNYYVLTAGTVIIMLISWFVSIRYKRFHGVARFFAFESIFILFLLNTKSWFINPFSLLQILSWILLFLSIYPVTYGFILLHKKGNPDGNFENTSALVKTGIYKYIRHPLYLSVFLLGTGVMLKDPGPVQLVLGVINMTAVFLTAKIEEDEMIKKFKDEYRTYMKESKMFIPFVL